MTVEEVGAAVMENVGPTLKKLKEVADRLAEIWRLLDTMEDYELFEAAHPRKKPRGSIRRRRRQK